MRANRTHITRLASGNWSRKKNTLPVLTTTTACTVMTRAEIVTRPGTVPVTILRMIATSHKMAAAAIIAAFRPASSCPTM